MKCEIIDLKSYREKKQQEELDELAEKVRAVVEEYTEEQPYGIYGMPYFPRVDLPETYQYSSSYVDLENCPCCGKKLDD
tara:strand:+ start:424 stop:660 length:237 start_codon:yes stop_codon:yes gene_type:complete